MEAFWSITVYNADGYLEANEIGSYTIHVGGDPESVNYLPITEGWNYAVRMYETRSENIK